MKRYRNLNGNSGVIAYELATNAIIIAFTDGGLYLYDHWRPGKKHVEEMKTRAEAGKGLATYINQHVREKYSKKL